MSFRIFLLSLGFLASAVSAQENTPSEPASAPEAPAASTIAPAPAESAVQLPLDAAALQSVGVPHSKEERDDMAVRAAALRSEAQQRKQEAEQTLSTAKVDCWKKFLVSSCLDKATVAHRKDISLSKHQEHEAQTLERNVRKFDAAEHARLRDEENARRDAENEKKAERYRAKRAAEEKAKDAGR